MNLPLVRLYDLVGTALIVPWPTGVRFSNQTGGFNCRQPEVEGFCLPIGSGLDSAAALEHYFVSSAHGGTGAIGGLSSDDADAIDRILRRDGDLKVLSVDRKRLAESHEAWVYVRVDPKIVDGLLVSNLEVPSSAILTWPNSD